MRAKGKGGLHHPAHQRHTSEGTRKRNMYDTSQSMQYASSSCILFAAMTMAVTVTLRGTQTCSH